MDHILVSQKPSYLFSVSYSSDILVLVLQTTSPQIDIHYELQFFDGTIPSWMQHKLGTIHQLYRIIVEKRRFEVVEHIGMLRIFLDEKQSQGESEEYFANTYVLKLHKKSESRKQIAPEHKMEEIISMSNDFQKNENFPNIKIAVEKKDVHMADESEEVIIEKVELEVSPIKTRFARLKKQEQNKQNNNMMQRPKVEDLLSECIVLDPIQQMMFRRQKQIQKHPSGIFKKQTESQKQQINKLKKEAISMKKTIEQMKQKIMAQEREIQRLVQSEQSKEELLKFYGQKYPNRKQMSLNDYFGLKEWKINFNSTHINDFEVKGLKITFLSKVCVPKENWAFIFLHNTVQHNKQFNLSIKITSCLQKNMAFGIIKQSQVQKGSYWNQKNCIEYVGFSRRVFQGGKYVLESGLGVWQGMTLTMTVNLKQGNIKWSSDRGLEASIDSWKLKKPQYEFVPYIRFKDVGDEVVLLGHP